MATIEQWTPFGVALSITATTGTVTRTSATRYTVTFNVSWKCYWSGSNTWYGMWVYANDLNDTNKAITNYGAAHSSGSTTITGTYSISGTSKQTKSVKVTFENYNSENGDSAKKSITLSVSVPAWPTYAVKYNANGGSGAPSAQTKVKGVALKLSTTKPTRTGYTFRGWATSSTATSPNGAYDPGDTYSADAALTLYAVWKANTYTIKFDANGGAGAPSNVTKTYGKALTLPTATPTRTNYNFLGWSASASAAEATYQAGGSYTANSAATLYAVWELSYWAPKVTNVLIGRCDADGNDDDLGTYFKVSFGWECCQLLGANEVSSIVISWGSASEDVTPNGTTAGVQSHVLGGNLSIDESYDVSIVVTDGTDSTTLSTRINAYSFAIDYLAGGKGTAIGKAAELENFLDVAFKLLVRDTSEVKGNTANTGAFIIGDPEGQHVGFDSNEVQAKAGPTTPGWYYINKDGGPVWIGSADGHAYFPGGAKCNKPVETHFMTRRCSTVQALTTSGTRFDMGYTNDKRGAALTECDKGIKCLVDGHVIVYGTIYATEMTAGNNLGAYIIREKPDGTLTSWGLAVATTGTRTYSCVSVAPVCMPVEARDCIFICAYNPHSATGTVAANARSVLTVQYI